MVGIILHEIRKERKYSFRKLAQKSGLSHSFICDIEQGRSNPSFSSLEKLASALGVPPEKFFEKSVNNLTMLDTTKERKNENKSL